MTQNYNYNYVFVMYDVGEKRCQKLFKICKKYLNHYQLSVFRGKITPSLLISMRKEIQKVINKEEDHVVIIKLLSHHYFEEESFGIKVPTYDDDLFV